MYNQPSLPYDPQRLTQPWMQIDVNNPPFVPNYQCEPYLMQYGPYVAGLLMLEIQGRAQDNPLRTFAYNMYAMNGFNNADFCELFAAMMDYVAMMMYQRRFASPDEAAAQLVEEMVDMAVALNVQDYPPLQNYITQDVYYSVQETIQQQQRMRHARQVFRNQNPVFGYGPQQQQSYARPYQQQQGHPQYQPRGGGGYQPPGHMVGAAAPHRGPQPPASLSRPQQQMQQRPPGGRFEAQQQSNRGGGSKYAQMLKESAEDVVLVEDAREVLRQPFNPRTKETMDYQQSNMQQVPLEDDGSFLIPEAESTYVWKPTAEQPYRPIYHPSTETRYHRVYPDGRVEVEVHAIPPTDMDFEKHNIANVFGKPRQGVAYDQSRALEKFAAGAREVGERFGWQEEARGYPQEDTSEQANAARAKAAEPAVSVVTKENWYADISIDGIMITAGVARLAHNAKGTPADVYRMNAYLAEPVLCISDQSDFVRRVSESRSYLELAEKLSGAHGEADVALVEAITKRAIAMLNRVLCLNLSIPKAQLQLDNEFDSATIQQLESILQNDYGAAVYNAYKAKQREHISAIFVNDDGQAMSDLRSNVIDTDQFPEGKKPFPVFLTSKMTFTMLDMYVHDLDINFDADTGSLLTEKNSGDLFQVVQDLFNKAKLDGGNTGFYRHLFQTNDGALLEIVEGDLVAGSYLISRVPQPWIG